MPDLIANSLRSSVKSSRLYIIQKWRCANSQLLIDSQNETIYFPRISIIDFLVKDTSAVFILHLDQFLLLSLSYEKQILLLMLEQWTNWLLDFLQHLFTNLYHTSYSYPPANSDFHFDHTLTNQQISGTSILITPSISIAPILHPSQL